MSRVIGIEHDTVIVDGTRFTEPPKGTFDGLAPLLGRVARQFEGEGVVLLSGEATKMLGFPERAFDTATDHPVLAKPRAAGWIVSGVSPWMTFWGTDRRPSIHVGLHEQLAADEYKRTGPMLAELAEMVGHLSRFHEVTGMAFHGTPGVTGIGGLRDVYAPRTKAQPRWVPESTPATALTCEPDIMWTNPTKSDGRYIHAYDANLAYLAGFSAAEVSLNPLKPLDFPKWDPSMAGYWEILVPHWSHPQIPPPWITGERGSTKWVTTPTLRLIEELAADGWCEFPEILRAHVGEGRRIMRRWAETLRDAAADTAVHEGDAPVRAAIKATIQQTSGMLARPGGRIYRPDWRNAVIASYRSVLWRKAWNVGQSEGRWPESIRVDSLRYTSDEVDPVRACPGIALGQGLGKFKVESKHFTDQLETARG